MKKILCGALLSIILIVIALLCGCGNNEEKNVNKAVEPTQQTVENDSISVTVSSAYRVEKNQGFYDPSITIFKSDKEYIQIETLDDGDGDVHKNAGGTYSMAKLKADFEECYAKVTGMDPFTDAIIGDKVLYKTGTSINAVEGDIYRTYSESNTVYQIKVVGPDFKDTDEAMNIVKDITLK